MADPISIASLALGGASLAIQVFDGIRKGYGYFESAANMDDECGVLKIRLMAEYDRLLKWGDATGLTDEKRHPEYDTKMRVNRALVFAILGEIQSRLKTLSKLSLEKYENLSWEDSAHSRRGMSREPVKDVDFEKYENIFKSVHVTHGNPRYHKGLNTVMMLGRGVKNIVKQPKRMRWALSDRTLIEESIERISQLTAYLLETLGSAQMEILLERTQETWLGMLQLTTTVKGMEQLLTAMHAAKVSVPTEDSVTLISGGTTLVASPSDQSYGDGDAQRYTTLYERLTKFSIVVAKSNGRREGEGYESKRMTAEDVKELTQREDRDRGSKTLATYRGRKVWIEWKRYTSVSIDIGQGMVESGPDPEIVKSVERLISLLQIKLRPAEFCAPSCLGYILAKGTDARFGFVYEADGHLETPVDPQSLLERFEEGGTTVSLRARISLAQDLATSLMYLHAVNWLHKGFRSASILLFPGQGSGELGKLRLSGLEYARPDEVGLTSTGPPQNSEWGVYCHPGYLGLGRKRGFRKTYDIYSLGIVLIEIAYWKAADEILGFTESQSDLGKIRGRLLTDDEKILDHVRVTMGERYHSATKACIEGMEAFGLPEEADQNDPAIGALLQQAFLYVVVDALKSIVI
ncbi:hypothetical protein K432DRAFT_287852 [Lepidopterella palustris CBS 459.81]|uniref:Protein kinase domain-containing protein n=1 Tax=Lepidopterella palustris CBS 459.81 TaxID=1314670 RepID=A0A8E2EJ86_9PEZI|nr:hypothetical protein K432DRAFT_287852 [Lepidopterella palustris CBS 459.81]